MTPKTTSAALSSISRVVSFMLFPQSLPQSLHERDKAEPRSAGWQLCNLASAQLDHGPGVAVTRSPSNRNGVYFGARVRWFPQGNRLQRRSETVGYFRADQPGRYLAVSAPWAKAKKV